MKEVFRFGGTAFMDVTSDPVLPCTGRYQLHGDPEDEGLVVFQANGESLKSVDFFSNSECRAHLKPTFRVEFYRVGAKWVIVDGYHSRALTGDDEKSLQPLDLGITMGR